MILVLAALTVFLGLIFGIYRTKIEPNKWASNQFQIFQSVITALENAKSANGGAFPAATNVDLGSATAPTDTKAKLVWYAVTGGNPSSDTAGWMYSCSGNAIDITVDISTKPSDAAAGVFIQSVINNTNYTLASGDETQNTVTFRRAGVLCN
jgi:hypothetical protein